MRGKPASQRQSMLRSHPRAVYDDDSAVVDTDCEGSSGVDEYKVKASVVGNEERATEDLISNSDVAVQASIDNMDGWVTVGRPYRRQQSNVSDSTSCSSSGNTRNAAVILGRYNQGPRRPSTAMPRQQMTTTSSRLGGHPQPRGSTLLYGLHLVTLGLSQVSLLVDVTIERVRIQGLQAVHVYIGDDRS